MVSPMEFPTFIPVQNGQTCPATQYNIDHRWNMCSLFQDELVAQWQNHLVTFAIYLTPIFGALVKLVDTIMCGVCLVIPENMYDPSISNEVKFKDIKERVAELQVNDFLYCLAQTVRVLFLVALEVFVSELMLFWIVADVILFTIYLYSRFFFSKKALVDALYRPEQATDLAALNELRQVSNKYYRVNLLNKEKAFKYFKRLHMIFYECVPGRVELAKKILLEDEEFKIIIMSDPLDPSLGEEAIITVQNWSFIQSRLIQISNS